MPAVAEKVVAKPTVFRPGVELPAPRRFESADLNTHGGWILERLKKALPDLHEQGIASWLSGVMYSGEHLFLYQEHSVGMAQVFRVAGLEGKPVVRERFVFAQEGYVDEASYFYLEFKRWAKNLGADVMVVEEMTDVPHDTIKEILGNRLFTRQEVFARL